MICITGDVHHEYDAPEQQLYEGTELEAAQEYVEISSRYGLDVTLFLTGKSVRTEPENVRALSNRDNVEIGGHTWSAFRPQWLHQTCFKRLFGTKYGPKPFQRMDIWRTLRVLRDTLGEPVHSWRTHSYASTSSTYEILSGSQVRAVSDIKEKEIIRPQSYDSYDLVEFPINVITDHEHIYHGARTHASVQENIDNGWTDTFGPESYLIEEWSDIVIDGIERVQEKNGISTLLVHPGCMKVADDMTQFERICSHIEEMGYDSKTIKNALS